MWACNLDVSRPGQLWDTSAADVFLNFISPVQSLQGLMFRIEMYLSDYVKFVILRVNQSNKLPALYANVAERQNLQA